VQHHSTLWGDLFIVSDDRTRRWHDTNIITSVRLKDRVPVLPHTMTYKNNNRRFGDHINQSTYPHLYLTVTKYNMFSGGQRQTTTLHYVISTMWETKPRTTPQKISRLLVGPEQVTRPETLQAIRWWWWWCD